MIRQTTLAVASTAMLLSGCASMDNQPSSKVVASTTLLAADGSVAGNATLATMRDGYEMRVEVRGMTPGVHGIHLHTTGRCQPRDFASAGGHLNPYNRQHGTLNPQGSHLGDLPNIQVGADGTASVSVPLMGSIGQNDAALFDQDGTALVIHAGADDYRSDPSGDSGGRIACGVLVRVR